MRSVIPGEWTPGGWARGGSVRRRAALALMVLALTAASAAAQQVPPIGKFAVDVRPGLAHFPQNEDLAAIYGLAEAELPAWGNSIEVGAHYFPFRWRSLTFGVGGSVLAGRAHRGPVTEKDGSLTGTDATSFARAVTPQLSINFGNSEGFSYVSGGLGLSWLTMETTALPEDVSQRRTTINYGAGARWYATDHVGITIDLRVLRVARLAPTAGLSGLPGVTVFIFSAGATFK